MKARWSSEKESEEDEDEQPEEKKEKNQNSNFWPFFSSHALRPGGNAALVLPAAGASSRSRRFLVAGCIVTLFLGIRSRGDDEEESSPFFFTKLFGGIDASPPPIRPRASPLPLSISIFTGEAHLDVFSI